MTRQEHYELYVKEVRKSIKMENFKTALFIVSFIILWAAVSLGLMVL